MAILQVELVDIERLSSGQLQTLLNKLIHLEARSNEIARCGIAVPDAIQITVPDGGIDGFVQWTDGPPSTPWLTNRIVGFQCKATEMGVASCRAAMLNAQGDAVADMVRRTLDQNGHYVMFCRKGYVEEDIEDRLVGMREGLRSVGYPKAEEAALEFYDGNKIRDWANEFQPAVNWVRSQVGKATYPGVQTFESWARNEDVYQFDFVEDESLRSRLDALVDSLVSANVTVRLTGLPGLGKTRLAYEAIARSIDPDKASQKAVRESVLYINASDRRMDAKRIAEDLRDDASDALLVIDDCDIALHNDVAGIARHQDSRFSLLTLDFEPEGERIGTTTFSLEPASSDIIKGILEQAYGAMPAEDSRLVVEFSEGFPQMAVLLAEARLSGTAEFQQLITPDVLQKLVWGREANTDPNAEQCLEVCSLFKFLGVDGDVRPHLEYAADLAGVTPEKFEEVVNRFTHRKRIQRAGRFVQVTPRPLALSLATNWWRVAPRATWEKLFDGTVPDTLVQALCDQLAFLNGVNEAREKVADLCGPQMPFGQAEVLNTEQGSRCFRSLVEVNPESTAEALERAFGDWSIDQLNTVISGRRNLVWALEKLAFNSSTFLPAARMLMRLAAAENESWGNNASGQFEQLFHIRLSGTEIPAINRLTVVDEGLASGDQRVISVALSALDNALRTQGFTRAVGAEIQGAGPTLVEWKPQTWGDIREYYSASLDRLNGVIVADDVNRNEALSIIGRHIRGLINVGMIDVIESIVAKVKEYKGETWVDGLSGISAALHFDFSHEEIVARAGKSDSDTKSATEDLESVRDRLQNLFSDLYPVGTANLIRLLVVDPPTSLFPDGSDYRDQEARHLSEIDDLANQTAADNGVLLEMLPQLLASRSPRAYVFGEKLGVLLSDAMDLLTEALSRVRGQEIDAGTPNFMRGLIAGIWKINPDKVNEALDLLANDEALVMHLVPLTSAIPIGQLELDRIIRAVAAGTIDEEQCRQLSWGSVLNHAPAEGVERLLSLLCDKGLNGCWVATEILGMYSHGQDERKRSLAAISKRIVLMPGLLAARAEGDTASHLDDHIFEQLAVSLVRDEGSFDVVVHLARELVALVSGNSFPYPLEYTISRIVKALFEFHAEIAWPIFGEAIINTDDFTTLNIETLIAGLGRDEMNNIEIVSDEILVNWAESAGTRAKQFLLKVARPLDRMENGGYQWSRLVNALLDHFGNDPEVLHGLSSNIWTYSHTGPLYTYFEQYLGPLERLKDHPHDAVREWALNINEALTKEIADEVNRENEEALTGILH